MFALGELKQTHADTIYRVYSNILPDCPLRLPVHDLWNTRVLNEKKTLCMQKHRYNQLISSFPYIFTSQAPVTYSYWNIHFAVTLDWYSLRNMSLYVLYTLNLSLINFFFCEYTPFPITSVLLWFPSYFQKSVEMLGDTVQCR